MCGISGIFYPEKMSRFSPETLNNLELSQQHRGPDAHAHFADENTFLAHNRLSIIDLSAKANQPMLSHNGRYAMVYNGEVYNYTELKAKLEKINPSVAWRSTSDSEVILEAFSIWGPAFTEHLNGMFAIAIYDKQQQQLYVCRDRAGIKPLYYYYYEGLFCFASELKAFYALRDHLLFELDRDAISAYLHLGYIPAPFSIYKQIRKLLPGHALTVNKNELHTTAYWKINNCLAHTRIEDEKEAGEQLELLLNDAVQLQLNCDVPFGTFLSGGIDSSLVTALAAKHSPKKLNTFSIGFNDKQYNEAPFADRVAKHLQTDHHEFIVGKEDMLPLVEQVSSIYDEPYADSSAYPTLLVSQLARKQVTVALSGDGGDELFMGYGSYQWAKRLQHPLVKNLRGLRALLPEKYKKAKELLHVNAGTFLPAHIFSQEQLFFSEKQLSLYPSGSNKYIRAMQEQHLKNIAGHKLSAMEQQAIFDLQYYLPDDLLTKVDRASMHHSLETRVPLLDHRIIEFSLRLSPELKYKQGQSKYLVKKILYKHVPAHFFDRPKKGFAIPLAGWLRHELRFLVDEYLSQKSVEKYNLIRYADVQKLCDEFYAGKTYRYNKLWALIVLHIWLKKNPYVRL